LPSHYSDLIPIFNLLFHAFLQRFEVDVENVAARLSFNKDNASGELGCRKTTGANRKANQRYAVQKRHHTEFCNLHTTLLPMPGSEMVRLQRGLPPMLKDGPLNDTLMAIFYSTCNILHKVRVYKDICDTKGTEEVGPWAAA